MMYDEKIEAAVLGAVLLESNLYFKIADSLSEDCFFDPANAFVYKAMTEVAKNSKIDLLTVSHKCAELRMATKDEYLKGLNWPYHVSALTTNIGNSTHIREHIAILKT